MTRFRHLAAVVAWALPGVATSADAAEGDLGPAPDFTVQTLDGAELSRASLEGKVVVVNFWATWCPDCLNALPGYVALQKEFGHEADFVFLGISLDERPAEVVRRFVEKNQVNYRVAMGDDSLPKAFGGIEEIPTTFVIDRSGTIRYKQGGAIDREAFSRLLRSLL